MNYYISVDIGTSYLKIALFDEQLTVLHIAKSPILKTNANNLPYAWQEACITACMEITTSIRQYRINSSDIYITVSGNGPSIVCLDKGYRVIFCIPWYNHCYETIPDESSYYLPQVQYIRIHHPKIFSNIHIILPAAEYFSFLLHNTPYTFVPHKQFLQYIWNRESIAKNTFSNSLFPKPIKTGTKIGCANTTFVKKLGLNNATIVAGGLDYMSALIGAGSIQDNHFCLKSGTSVVLNACLSDTKDNHIEKEIHPDYKHFPVFILPHFFPQYINKGVTIPYYDMLYKIAAPALPLCNNKSLLYDVFIKQREIILSCVQALSTIEQEINASQCLMQFFSKTEDDSVLSQYQLTEYQSKNIFVLFTLLFMLKKSYQILTKNIPNNNIQHAITASGGHTHSDIFMQLQADVLNRTFSVFEPVYCELRGNAIIGIVASRNIVYQDITHTYFIPKAQYIPHESHYFSCFNM